MSKPVWLTLTESEKRIWETAYAGAYLYEFYRGMDAARSNFTGLGESPFDSSLKIDHAEVATVLADAAVANLRQWRTDGLVKPDKTKGAPKRVDGQWVKP